MLTYEQDKRLKLEVGKTIDIINDFSPNVQQLITSINLLTGNNSFEGFDFLYPSATEDMDTYYKQYQHPRTFLTIGGSGEQLLNAVSIGAKKIDVFDSNPLSKRGCALRVAGAKILNPDELIDFYSDFSEDVYSHISTKLNEEDLAYWNAIYDYVGEEGIRCLFSYNKIEKDLLRKMNPYLDKDKYQNLQRKLEEVEITYIDSTLYQLPSFLKENTYDGMTFSNIYEYLNLGLQVSKKKAEEYHDFIINKMYPRLNKNGVMMAAYMYAFNDQVKESFEQMKKNHNNIVPPGVLTFDRLEFYRKGLTTQNYAYCLLLDEFRNDPVSKIATNHIVYGQSEDMSHDMALCLKK